MDAVEIVDQYFAGGYQGIAITDHFNEDNFRVLPEYKKDWKACVDHFLCGYRKASARAGELGMDAILGIEHRSPGNAQDTLIFGVDEEFLYEHEYFYEYGIDELFGLFGDDMTFVAAHPFRIVNGSGLLYKAIPQYLHGIEVINANARHTNNYELLLDFCGEYPELIRIVGSDTHRPADICQVYMGFNDRVADAAELRIALHKKEYILGYPAKPEIARMFA